MKARINVQIEHKPLWVRDNIVFSHVSLPPFGTPMELKMDLIVPREAKGLKLPCIVWLCGGAWLRLNPAHHLVELARIARAGYVIASVQYRTLQETFFPAQVVDVKAAIRFLRANAKKYGVDPKRIGVMGESAGGHLAALTAVTEGIKEYEVGENLKQSSAVQACCAWYPPVDLALASAQLDKTDKIALDMLGFDMREFPPTVEAADILPYINDKTPPFLLLHGTKDQIINISQSQLLYEALILNGTPVIFYEVEGAGHADEHFFQTPIKQTIIEFFDKFLKGEEK